MAKSGLTDRNMHKRVTDLCDLADILYYHNPDPIRARMAGFPDLCLIPKELRIPGAVFVELKSDDDRLSEDQAKWIKRILLSTPNFCFVVRGNEGLDKLEDFLLNSSGEKFYRAMAWLQGATTEEVEKVDKRIAKRKKKQLI